MSGDRTSELWLKIDRLHIKYLQAEDTPAKLEIRKKLEGDVTEYLNLLPHDRKSISITTRDIILQSARWIRGFSLTKASNAFGAIERYAANLINQPWRQEFWSIKQYSGFYKNSVQSSLSGAEKLFYDMGYRETAPHCMELSGTKPGGIPVNFDAVTSVARDCLLASVECNILAGIHNCVSLHFQISMEELFKFRKDHIGTAEKAMQELIYRKNQAQSVGAPWEGAPPTGYGLNSEFMPPCHPGLPGYMPYQGLGHQFPLQTPGFPQGVNPAIPSHIDQMKDAQAAQLHKGGLLLHNRISMHNAGFPPQASTPTTKGQVYTSTEGVDTDEEIMKNITSLRLNGKMYSGRQMERQVKGRRDISESEQDPSKYDSAVSEEDGRNRQHETLQRATRGSGYTKQQSGIVQNQWKTSVERPEGNIWECNTCTFHNREDKSICKICGKTRDQPTARKSEIDVQSDDGGLTCDKCTLLNKEGNKMCEACGATLGMVSSPIRLTRKNSWESMRRNSQLEFPPLC